jgi:hypothetical protein
MGERTIEDVLVDALSKALTRRMATRIVDDVRRGRGGAPLPEEMDELMRLVRSEVADAAYLRMGAQAGIAIAELEERIATLSAMPPGSWRQRRERLLFVGRSQEAADRLAAALGVAETQRVDELWALLVEIEKEERTLLVIDAEDTALDVTLLSRFVPDFPGHVFTFVVRSCVATRESFLKSGAAFRATLRPEPSDHPDVEQAMRDVLAGVPAKDRRHRSAGGSTTTTEPRRAA